MNDGCAPKEVLMPLPQLSEKTLELNVISELTYLFRIAGRNPYYIGYTQFEELRNGTDIMFQAGHEIMFLQFKKGYCGNDFFTFNINNNKPHYDQHQTFLSQGGIANACRYVFPLIGDHYDVYTLRGKILSVTPFIPATTIGNLNPSNRQHRIRLWYDGTMTKHSQKVDLGSWREHLLLDDMPLNQIERETANEIINSFQLPTLRNVLPQIFEVAEDREKYESIFGLKRSGFCMIFESNRI